MTKAKAENKNKSGESGVVIVAAGTSQRMGGINKLFASLGGKPLLAWSVDVCQRCELIKHIVVVLNYKDLARGQRLKEERAWSKVSLCAGGPRRQDSVMEGLRHVRDHDWVMIHDGARPFLTAHLIEEGLKIAKQTGAAVAAVPVNDTVKLVDSERLVKRTLRRDRLWAAQTPQVFSFDMIMRAYEKLRAEVTDDAAVLEQQGHRVQLYMGDYENIKVTTPGDLALARVIAGEWKKKR